MSRFAIVAFLVAACGSDDDSPPGEAVASLDLALTVPDVLAVGAPLHIAWTVDGEQPDQPTRLLLRLRGPGALAITPSSAGYLNTGSIPANGELHWIAADGSLSPTPIAVSEPAVSGAIDVVLPNTAGDWAVDGLILEGDQGVDAYAHGVTWVAPEGASARLELSHTWAAPDSYVRAAVRLHNTANEPLRLSAWLTLPDDRVLSLPNRQIEYTPALEGTFEPQRFELFGADLGTEYGEGRYAVSLKLETLDGVTRASAGGIIRVCSTTGTLTGTVVDGGGGALGSGELRAYGPDRTLVRGEVDASGAFSLPVPAGLYVLLAIGDGWRAASRAVEVDCGGTQAIELRGTLAASARRRHGKPSQKAAPTTSRFSVLVRTNVSNLYPIEERPDFTEPTRVVAGSLSFKNTLEQYADEGELDFLDNNDQEAILRPVVNDMLLGEEDVDRTARAFAQATDFDAVIDYTVRKPVGNTEYSLSGIVRGIRGSANGIVFNRADRARIGDQDELGTSGAPEIAIKLLDGLVARLQEGRENPFEPDIQIRTDKEAYTPGEPVIVTATVRDKRPARVVADREIHITMRNNQQVFLEQATVTTGALGVAKHTFVAPQVSGMNPTFALEVALPRQSADFYRTHVAGIPLRPGNSRLASPKGTLDRGESAPVSVAGQGLSPGLTTQGVNGSTDSPTLRLDAQGRATFNFTATQELGPAAAVLIAHTLIAPAHGAVPVVTPINFYVVDPYVMTASADPSEMMLNDQYASVHGTITNNGQGVAGVSIAVATQGLGFSVAGGVTDSTGEFRALFRSPTLGTGSSTVTISAVLDGGRVLEQQLTFAYGPGCTSCGLEVSPDFGLTQAVPMRKGAQLTFATNQPVTWTTTAGTIAQGLFTAPQEGGVVHLTATTLSNPPQTKRISIVVDCSIDELDGNFGGTIATTFGSPPGIFDCPMGMGIRIVPFMVDGFEADLTYGCPIVSSASFVDFGGQGCSVTFTTGDFVSCNPALVVSVQPNLELPGNNSRVVDLRAAHGNFPPDGNCVLDYTGRGIVNR